MFSLNDFGNETWDIKCTLISGSNSNLYMSLNTYSAMENNALILGKLVSLNKIIKPTLYSILCLLALILSLFHFPILSNKHLGHLKMLFVFFGQILTMSQPLLTLSTMLVIFTF
jgi:hypothetical protein